jgi:methyltransferase-like protein
VISHRRGFFVVDECRNLLETTAAYAAVVVDLAQKLPRSMVLAVL